MENILIGIIDDMHLFREGVAALINGTPGMKLVFEAHDGTTCLTFLDKLTTRPHILLMDMEMPGMDGMELNEEIHRLYPDIKVIILSIHDKERLIARMIQAGVSGYLVKNCGREELIRAIKTTHSSGFYINAQTLKAIQNTSPRTIQLKNPNGIKIDLSPREIEVLKLICLEHNNVEIGEKLFISPRTVEGHRINMLGKTACRNTAGLVLFAIKHHIFELDY